MSATGRVSRVRIHGFRFFLPALMCCRFFGFKATDGYRLWSPPPPASSPPRLLLFMMSSAVIGAQTTSPKLISVFVKGVRRFRLPPRISVPVEFDFLSLSQANSHLRSRASYPQLPVANRSSKTRSFHSQSYGFGAYFNILRGSEWSALMLTYGFPMSIIGMALKYAELKPAPCLIYSDAQLLREKYATPILKDPACRGNTSCQIEQSLHFYSSNVFNLLRGCI
ncbi:hypothetical protein L2E82_05508 [Cichorium intybus]|uniref:Uncharacterized protein n=1 Tax=Cichorium intybus TaxID=13427 RepID=A0ACB9H6Z8_CICIN|nr:hypothetical protein L2E82_05508 [Cichorium intybus]